MGSAFCQISFLKGDKIIYSKTVKVTQNGPSEDKIKSVNLQERTTNLGIWMLCASQSGVNTNHFSKWMVSLKVKKPSDNGFHEISENEFVHAN